MDLKEEMLTTLEAYHLRMKRSGHSPEEIGKIISRGLGIYTNKVQNHMEGVRDLHRKANETAKERREKQLMIGSSWFKKQNNSTYNNSRVRTSKRVARPTPGRAPNRPIDTVVFIPRTPGGSLAPKIRETEQQLAEISNFKIRIVEECGVTHGKRRIV